jgi:lysophospholipase
VSLGTRERIVETPTVHARVAGWARAALDLYPGAEHEIMMETPATRLRFFDRAVALFEANRSG